MHSRSCFRTPFGSQLVKGSQTLQKSAREHFWLYVLIMSRTCFRVNRHSIVAWMSRNSLLERGAKPVAESTFILFFHHSEINWVRKRLSSSDLKSRDSLFSHWLPMPRILTIIEKIYRNQFKCIYVKNLKLYLDVLLRLRNPVKFKIWASLLKYFGYYPLLKAWLLKYIAVLLLEHPSAVNVLMGPKHCKSLCESTYSWFWHKMSWKVSLFVRSEI